MLGKQGRPRYFLGDLNRPTSTSAEALGSYGITDKYMVTHTHIHRHTVTCIRARAHSKHWLRRRKRIDVKTFLPTTSARELIAGNNAKCVLNVVTASGMIYLRLERRRFGQSCLRRLPNKVRWTTSAPDREPGLLRRGCACVFTLKVSAIAGRRETAPETMGRHAQACRTIEGARLHYRLFV